MYQTHQAVQQNGADDFEGEVAGAAAVVAVEDVVQQEHGSQAHQHLHSVSEKTDIHVPVVLKL